MSFPTRKFKPENFKRLTRTQFNDALLETWVIVTEPDGSETTYHLPKKLADLLPVRDGLMATVRRLTRI